MTERLAVLVPGDFSLVMYLLVHEELKVVERRYVLMAGERARGRDKENHTQTGWHSRVGRLG